MGDFGSPDSVLDQAVDLDLRTYLPDDILFKVDIATMSHSIEARCPYLDINVASYAMQMPDSYKIHAGQTKSLLRFLGHRYLPSNIINREKQGFTVPLDLWLGESLKKPVQDLLTDRSIKERGLLNKKYIESMLLAHYSGKTNHSKQIWVLLMLELWLQNNHL
jgi:asparagine synthase (glutamine-hydrolysing)